MLRWFLYLGAAIAALGMMVLAIGYRLPKRHSAFGSVRVAMPPEALYAALTDVDRYPSWRHDVKKVTRLPDREGHPAWTEDGASGRLPLVFERMEAPSARAPGLLVARIADASLPFGGTWTYRIVPTTNGSELSITEDGEIYNPIFRFMARFVFGYEGTIKGYLGALAARAQAGGPSQ